MKCGSCRTTNADAYNKITDDGLLEILKTMNPNRRYNPKYIYFCDVCIQSAMVKQAMKLTTVSYQNANTFSVVNASTSTNDSESSRDEYDELVSSRIVFSDKGTPLVVPSTRSKRLTQSSSTAKPCPKRFKKPLAPVELPTITESTRTTAPPTKASPKRLKNPSEESLSQKEKPNATQPVVVEVISEEQVSSEPQSSESISFDMMLNVNDTSSSQSVEEQPTTASRQERRNNSLSNKETPHSHSMVLNVSNPVTPVRNQNESSSRTVPYRLAVNTTVSHFPHQTGDSVNNVSLSSHGPTKQSTKGRIPAVAPVPNRTESSVSTHPHTKESTKPTVPVRLAVNSPKTTVRNQNEDSDTDDSVSSNQRTTTNPSAQSAFTVRSNNHQQDALPGPSAPVIKNPRIRQPNSDIINSVRRYFDVTNAEVNVNSYARSLAG